MMDWYNAKVDLHIELSSFQIYQVYVYFSLGGGDVHVLYFEQLNRFLNNLAVSKRALNIYIFEWFLRVVEISDAALGKLTLIDDV